MATGFISLSPSVAPNFSICVCLLTLAVGEMVKRYYDSVATLNYSATGSIQHVFVKMNVKFGN